MSAHTGETARIEEVWRKYLTTGEFVKEVRQRQICKLLPGHRRCKSCYAPFDGVGSRIARIIFNKRPSSLNPRICNFCEDFAHQNLGGAEIELTLLFADVRGSTRLAEQMSPREFGDLINRFYVMATEVLVHTDALIDKIIGDQVSGMYVPGFAGPNHARRALDAARQILKETGHGAAGGPWIPVGAGVHTGVAFVGAVGTRDGASDITVLGDAANTAARLSTVARVGEILVSEEACRAAGLDCTGFENRTLELKGKSSAVSAYVLQNGRPAA